ncbi:MAG TPA: DNA-binding response regulator, partial [Spirochaetia bacterium]|nr:DNA-binding response regulator [Spirochaetia bacterium]
RAVSAGVVDYLLKPVNGAQLRTLLEDLGGRISRSRYGQRTALLKKAFEGAPPGVEESERCLPFHRYCLAIVRSGGLPARHPLRVSRGELPLALDALGNDLMARDIWVIPGRDEEESVFVHSSESMQGEDFKKTILSLVDSLHDSCHTTMFPRGSFALGELAEAAPGLFRSLDAAIVLGRPQVIHGEPATSGWDKAAVMDNAVAGRLEFLLANAMHRELHEELERLLSTWEQERRPQLWVDAYLRQVVHLILKRSPAGTLMAGEDIELLLDETLHDSETFGDLMKKVWTLASDILKAPGEDPAGVDVPSLLSSIRRWVDANYAGHVTLQSACETFRVSQTYLSRLFRKHQAQSFNDYLTRVRLEAACRLIRENPLMPLKDVAAFVGYGDQFYFSRVFKAAYGIPPSEFARRGLS